MADAPQQAPIDNTTPDEKALAEKLMAELKASGVDVDALAKKGAPPAPPAPATPSTSSGPAAPPAPAPEPPKKEEEKKEEKVVEPPKVEEKKEEKKEEVKPLEPVPAPVPTTPSTSSGPAAPPVPEPPKVEEEKEEVKSTEETFVQSLDNKLSQLNDSRFFVIRITKVWFWIFTILIVLGLWFVPGL